MGSKSTFDLTIVVVQKSGATALLLKAMAVQLERLEAGWMGLRRGAGSAFGFDGLATVIGKGGPEAEPGVKGRDQHGASAEKFAAVEGARG